jgi:hypothetical protein
MKKNEIEQFPGNRIWQKAVLIMKLTTILYFVCLMQVSATVYSQATKFTFSSENKQIVDVLQEIEQSSNFRFFYQNEQIDVKRRVSVNASDATVEQILDDLFRGEGINYRVLEDNLVLLSPDEMTSNKATAQQNSISGKITDSNGESLPGVTVIIKGTTTGMVSDMDGNYTISNIPENATLQFSFIGMQTQEIVVGDQTTLDITMLTDAIGLEEVVAIGYGTARRKDISGAVSTVRLEDSPVSLSPKTNALQSLQGNVAGVNIGASNSPGETPDILVRGQNSING